MATKKPSTALVKSKSNLPVDLAAEQAAEVAAMQARINKPSGDKIKTEGKVFNFPDGRSSDTFEAIVVDFVTFHKYYTAGFVKGVSAPPVCFALGLEQANLTPSDASSDKQCASCAGCWANQYKSDPKGGNGKACKNERLLAILPLDADVETDLAILEVTPTGLKSFDGIVTKAMNANSPLRNFIVRFTFADESYPTVRFEIVGPTPKDLLLLAQSRKDEALKRLLTEPDYSAVAANEPVKGAKKPASRLLKRA